jgi:LDH2 family malate/lactate/ureidoglycolate dehydrogenase
MMFHVSFDEARDRPTTAFSRSGVPHDDASGRPEAVGFRYPGEGACQRRETNRRDGVPIDPAVWQSIGNETSAVA